MNKKALWIILILVVIAIGSAIYFQNKNTQLSPPWKSPTFCPSAGSPPDCAGVKVNSGCSYEVGNKTYRGTCLYSSNPPRCVCT